MKIPRPEEIIDEDADESKPEFYVVEVVFVAVRASTMANDFSLPPARPRRGHQRSRAHIPGKIAVAVGRNRLA